MTICGRCGGYIADIYMPGQGHVCPNVITMTGGNSWPRGYTKIVGCSLCGSTAIDHTEAECLRSRQLTPVRKNAKGKES